jgi:hypothetical protein
MVTSHPNGADSSMGTILHRFTYQGAEYAVIQKEHDSQDDLYLYRLQQEQLLEIEDEQEWEQAADYLDQSLFMSSSSSQL